MQAENPQPKPYYGFGPGNILRNTLQGAKGLVTGAYQLGKDLATNPNWVYGTPERPSTLEKFVMKPSEEQVQKAGAELQKGHTIPALGHSLASAIPFVGPWAASLGEQAGSGDIGGAAGQAVGTAGALKVPGLLRRGGQVARLPLAERIAGSMLGPERPNEFEVSRPAPAFVQEGPIALTRGGLIKNLGNRISGYNTTVKQALNASKNAPPEPVEPIVRRAADPLIDLARRTGEETTAASIERWRDNYLKAHPGNVPLDQLYELKADLGKVGKTFSGGPVEEPGLRAMKQSLVTEYNRVLAQRLPGIRGVTQRQSGLINAKEALENRARITKGSPLLPGLRVFAGEPGFLGGSFRLGLPEGTLAKALAVRAFGRRAPLQPIVPAR
jgi:hypothetical protein